MVVRQEKNSDHKAGLDVSRYDQGRCLLGWTSDKKNNRCSQKMLNQQWVGGGTRITSLGYQVYPRVFIYCPTGFRMSQCYLD